MASELNLGTDWEQSKQLVAHWHKRWAKAEREKQFIIDYLNPADTSFRDMMNKFASLTEADKDKIMAFAEAMAKLKSGTE